MRPLPAIEKVKRLGVDVHRQCEILCGAHDTQGLFDLERHMVSTRWRPAENHGRRLTLYSAVPRYWNVRGVAGFRLQPPDESQSFVRERIDRLKLRDEFSHLRIVERSNQAGNIDLREMVVHSGPQELLLKDALEIETVAENHLCK